MKNSTLLSILAIASTCAAQFDSEQCGPKAGNQKCKQNKCCSQYGWCGTSNAYCQAAQGCQAGFGRCTGILPSAKPSASSSSVPSTAAALISKNGRCGSAFGGQTCKGSTFGDCCSAYNWCGKTTDHCKASVGCQLGFGTCTGVQSSSMSVSISRSSSRSSNSASIVASSSAPQAISSSPSSSLGMSTTQIATSSSSSSVLGSSASSSVGSSQAVSSSQPVSSSSATVSSSSSLVSSSMSIAPSSSSASISSSTITSAPSPSVSGSTTVITRNLRAARNPSIDRTAAGNLTPKNALSFYFTEDGTSYTTTLNVNLDSGAQGILLENIASISSVTCSGSTINLQFSDQSSLNAASSWPAGTILFTLSDGCNTATERGVYKIGEAASPVKFRLRARVTSTAQNQNVYQLSLDVLLSQMEAVIASYDDLKRQAAEAAAASSSTPTSPSTISITVPSSASAAQLSVYTSPSASALPLCGGYAPGGRFDISGTSYQVSCTVAGTWRERWIDISYQDTFTACMAFCNTNAQCVAASWNVQQVQNGKYMCLRWPVLPYKTDNAVDSPLAVKIVVGSASSAKPVTTVTSTISSISAVASS